MTVLCSFSEVFVALPCDGVGKADFLDFWGENP